MKLLLLITSLLWAQQSRDIPENTLKLQDFTCGMVTRYASHKIPDSCVQDALNVYVDEDFGIERRRGYARLNETALTDTKSVRGLWKFDVNDGSRYIVALTSTSLWYTSGGNFTQIAGITVSASAEMDCTQSLGKFWCTNGTDNVFWWDGASTAPVTGAPKGTLIESFRNRIWIADVTSNRSTLYASGELDGTDWTTASASTSPITYRIGGVNDGTRLRCLGVYDDVLRAGKDDSFYGVFGFDQDDFVVRELSREVGCIENKSMQEKSNHFYWLSKRGIEKYDGTKFERVSDPVRDLVDIIINSAANLIAVTDTTQADFEAGNLTASGPGAPVSAAISGGSLVPSSWTITETVAADWTGTSSRTVVNASSITLYNVQFYDDFSDHNYTQNPAWTVTTGSWAVVNQALKLPTATGGNIIYASNLVSSGTWTWSASLAGTASANLNVWFMCNGSDGTTCSGYRFKLLMNSIGTEQRHALEECASGSCTEMCGETVAGSNATYTYSISRSTAGVFYLYRNGSQACTVTDTTYSTSNNVIVEANTQDMIVDSFHFQAHQDSGTYLSDVFNTGFSTPIAGPFTLTVTTSTGENWAFAYVRHSSSAFGVWSTLTAASDSVRTGDLKKQYQQYFITMGTYVSTKTPSVDVVGLAAATTGYFIGQCRNPGATISSWDKFECTKTDNNGSFTFWIATGTSCGNVTSPNATWLSQTNAAPISHATTTHVAYRVLWDIDSSTEAPILNDCTISWNAGENRPATSSAVYKDRYMLAYTTNTASGATNSHILVVDSKDRITLLTGINAHSMAIYNRRLHTGDSTATGRVYLQDSGSSDNGNSFTSSFRTKELDGGDPDAVKTFTKLYVVLEPRENTSQSVSVSGQYYLDRSTTPVSLGTFSLAEDSGLLSAEFPFPSDESTSGKHISIELSNTGADQVFKVYGMTLYYHKNEVQ